MYAIMNISFAEWLSDQLEERGWSQAELARRANTSRSSINGLITGSRNPGPELTSAIANALRLPESIVFKMAGILSPTTDIDELKEQILMETADMSPEEQQEILAYIRMKKDLRSEKEKKASTDKLKPSTNKGK